MINSIYLGPKNLEEGLKILSQNNGSIKILAGGSDLLNRIRSGKKHVEILLDASSFCLEYIREQGGDLVIGAMTKLSMVEDSVLLEQEPLAILRESAGQVGGWQTRNLATIGGNICTGNSSSDMAVALLALDAKLRLVSLKGERVIPIDEFFIAPRKVDVREDEILKEIIIGKFSNAKGWGSHFVKFGKRKSNCIATVNAGAVLGINNNTRKISAVRIAMGTVAPTPVRLYKTEKFLENRIFSQSVIDEAVKVMEKEISPRTSFRATKEFREDIARVFFNRAVQKSGEKALGGIV
ncbi:MAG: FAD binding domain-containing protein [Bacillota bacterium]|nr:FAD binding domain-containing protein [Bacillota bacterium]